WPAAVVGEPWALSPLPFAGEGPRPLSLTRGERSEATPVTPLHPHLYQTIGHRDTTSGASAEVLPQAPSLTGYPLIFAALSEAGFSVRRLRPRQRPHRTGCGDD